MPLMIVYELLGNIHLLYLFILESLSEVSCLSADVPVSPKLEKCIPSPACLLGNQQPDQLVCLESAVIPSSMEIAKGWKTKTGMNSPSGRWISSMFAPKRIQLDQKETLSYSPPRLNASRSETSIPNKNPLLEYMKGAGLRNRSGDSQEEPDSGPFNFQVRTNHNVYKTI